MTDSAKTLVLLRKHSILNVYERGSVYLGHKKFAVGGFRLMCHPVPQDGLVLFIDWYYPDSDERFVRDNAPCHKRLSG